MFHDAKVYFEGLDVASRWFELLGAKTEPPADVVIALESPMAQHRHGQAAEIIL